MTTRSTRIVAAGLAVSAGLLLAVLVIRFMRRPTLAFGYSESDDYADIYDAIIHFNGSKAAAKFFRKAHKHPVIANVPGTEGLTVEQKRRVFEICAQAAREEKPLPLHELPEALKLNSAREE